MYLYLPIPFYVILYENIEWRIVVTLSDGLARANIIFNGLDITLLFYGRWAVSATTAAAAERSKTFDLF